MEKRKFSDLIINDDRPETPQGCAILVQPTLTQNISKQDFVRAGEDFFKEVWDRITTPEGLTHVCSLSYIQEWFKRKTEGMIDNQCGKHLMFQNIDEPSTGTKRYRTHIFCHCGKSFKTELSKKELGETMLHLALKQMVPGLTCCNFLDWNTLETDSLLPAEEKIGLVSLLHRVLWRESKRELSWGSAGFYGLAFRLLPGMNTHDSCDGLDPWLQFLVKQYSEHVWNVLQRTRASVCGPKRR